MNRWNSDRRQFLIGLGLGITTPGTVWGDAPLQESAESSLVDWRDLASRGHPFEHWTPEEDDQWTWYLLEHYVDGQWRSVGRSIPIHKVTGELYQPSEGYVSPDRIPTYVQRGELPNLSVDIAAGMPQSQFDALRAQERTPDAEIQLRHGKPPSDWLISLHAAELREWLQSVDAPEATVSGMTFWVHLVRDHSFDPRCIEGLTEHEFLLLHSAAHHGY